MLKIVEKCSESGNAIFSLQQSIPGSFLMLDSIIEFYFSPKGHLVLILQPLRLGMKLSKKAVKLNTFQCWLHVLNLLGSSILQVVMPELDQLVGASFLTSALDAVLECVYRIAGCGLIPGDGDAEDYNIDTSNGDSRTSMYH